LPRLETMVSERRRGRKLRLYPPRPFPGIGEMSDLIFRADSKNDPTSDMAYF